MKIEEIKEIRLLGEFIHYNMISEKGGTVHFTIFDEEMWAYDWNVPGEAKIFLAELEKYADKYGLMLIVNNVVNPKLEAILRKAGYEDFYVKDPFVEDWMQCWRRIKKME